MAHEKISLILLLFIVCSFSCEDPLIHQTCWSDNSIYDESVDLNVEEIMDRLEGHWDLFCLSNMKVGLDKTDFTPISLLISGNEVIILDEFGMALDTSSFYIDVYYREKSLVLHDKSDHFYGGYFQLKADEVGFGDGRVDVGTEYYKKR